MLATSSSELEVKRFLRLAAPAWIPCISISEVARRSGVASSALRFYEERGLIASERAGSGHRRYPRSVLRRIAFIVFAQKIGLTLEEIGAELAKLPPDRVPTRGDWARLSGEWTARIDQRIAELQRLRGSAHRMHRLRLPVDRPLQARQPGGRRGAGGAGAEILDGVEGASRGLVVAAKRGGGRRVRPASDTSAALRRQARSPSASDPASLRSDGAGVAHALDPALRSQCWRASAAPVWPAM